jgi:hypothetical protein
VHSAQAIDVPNDNITNTFNINNTRSNLFIAAPFLS